MSVKIFQATSAALVVALIVSACGGSVSGSTSTASSPVASSAAEGSLLNGPPPRTASLSAAAFTAVLQSSLSGLSLLQMAGGTLACGVDVHYVQYATVGGAGEATTASGVLMVPTGSGPNCTGPRPVVEYAHGTTITRSYNLAAISDPTNQAYPEALLLAVLYAAQGYVVVAPNYAGYDSSTLAYHPYLNADQQSKDMIDALSAAKAALPLIASPITASSKLFLTGYSQGGYVAMATARAMQAAGTPVTASAFLSGPYALAAMADQVFEGEVDIGANVFFPMILTSYQKAYGNIYSSPLDVYESAYASGIETLLPGPYNFTTVALSGKLPGALFSSTPPAGPAALQPVLDAMSPPTGTGETDAIYALGFGANNLIRNSARLDYLLDAFANPDGVAPTLTTGVPAVSPQNPLRIALKKNDLRGWTPTSPVLLCGGHQDPVVYFATNANVMKQQWAGLGSLVTELDVDSAPALDGFNAARQVFLTAEAATAASGGALAVIGAYHSPLVFDGCMSAAATFFAGHRS
ncbi:alpha/beta hydrolase [Paraburkholderia acidicola]|uniref:alpha/beta hydrolase n=1 Tax=Paraburkholderia acidicola TaxID=1912599 RepID=UPI000BBC15E9|nr:prolyl oligopeptidase family serine peptidase [Paraburkholderia acidicola]